MRRITRDQRELIEKLLRIRDKHKKIVRFRFNPAQDYYWTRKTRRNLILKARQKGLTKVIDADQFIQCIRQTTQAVVISHERESTKRLFAAVKFYHDSLTVKPELLTDSTSMMSFPKRGSSFYVGTAGQRAFGRGDTIDRAHLSEAAFYPNLEATLAGVAEAAEYGQIDIETTANGREEFYDMWGKAKKGRSAYTPIFIPWFIDQEYSVEGMTFEMIVGLSPAVQEMFAIPEDEFAFTDEEKDLVRRVWADHQIMLTVGQIKWRRYKIWDKGDLFWQEYPEDDVTCFLQSGRSVFKKIKVDPTRRIALDDPTKMTADQRDRLLGNKEKKTRRKMLYAGLDPAEGTLTGDPHAFSIIEPWPQDGHSDVVYEYVSNEPIDVFAGKVEKICSMYNVVLGVEKQGVGVAMCRKLTELGVSFEEWNTTAQSRPVIVTELEEAYRKEELVETYEEAQDEALAMVYNDKNRPEHPANKHDDRIFSRGIALQMFKKPIPSVELI